MTCRVALAALLLLSAPTMVEAALIDVAFEGVITEVTGSVAGAPVLGTPFSGTVRYEADQPPIDPSAPAVFEFADGSARLSTLLAGFLYETDTSAPAVSLSRQLFTADLDTGDPVDPDDPNAVLAGFFNMVSATNVDVGAGDYSTTLSWQQTPILDFENLPLPPQSNALITRSLVSLGYFVGPGEIQVSFASGASFTGEILLAVPEPATALLLGAGLLALGLQRPRRLR